MSSNVHELVSKWLVEESFTIRKLEAPPEAKILWGLDVFTPGQPGVNFKIINPADKSDRVLIVLGIGISPDHKRELEKLRQTDRLKIISNILGKALSVCIDCQITVQPNMVDPQALSILLVLFNEEITLYGKPYFMRLIARTLNTYFAIISGFNEWFPVIPEEPRKKIQPYA
uniref:DUF2299 domain-containing protein n=1 Tax=Thermosphaera aggregans TaxID=54254 RepID=A0A7C2BL01_9CREN